jgi:hypothetical protein
LGIGWAMAAAGAVDAADVVVDSEIAGWLPDLVECEVVEDFGAGEAGVAEAR